MRLTRRQFMTLTVGALGGWLVGGKGIAQAASAYCPILMYHYISYPPEGANAVLTDLTVTPELFSEHLAFLQETGFTSITLAELWAGLAEGAALPEKPIVITFDDGYDNAYDAALGRLLERGMVGTFFLVSSFMEQPGYLTWGQAAEMKNAGMEIGNHSATHPNLTSMGYDGQFAEIDGAAAAIAAALGERPKFFCYPLGKYNATTLRVLKDTGHLAAVTTSDGTLQHSVNPFRMSRVRVRHTTSVSSLEWLVNRYL